MKKYFILILLLSISFAGLLLPEDDSTLRTTHIKFEWEQVPDAIAYIVEIDLPNGSTFISEIQSSLIYINTEVFSWNSNYIWRVFPVFNDGTLGNSINEYNFSIANSRSNAYANQYNTEAYSDGITIFGSFFDYYSAAIDDNGNEIWNTGNDNRIFYNTDYYGQLFGCTYDNSLENNLPGLEFNLEGDVIWSEPNDDFLHHDLIQLPNGNYMGIVETFNYGPIPFGPWSDDFAMLGYLADGITPEYLWVGDKIVEWDKDTHEVVWEWSVFDYYNMSDFDMYGDTWWLGFNDGYYDWTHVNAITYSEEENAIYISCRHLSRITKIDYETGEIIWNMGLEMPSGDVDCGQDLGFNFQHGIQVLENGNIVTLDNGNISTFINNTSYPTTRALEINVDNCINPTFEFEYELAENLFGFASGNVQKLENGSYLATTVGGGGTSLEITPNGEIVWEGKYNLSVPNGAVYRANRLSSLYPVAFSIVVPNMYLDNSNITLDYIPTNNFEIILYNDGSNDELFCVSETDECYDVISNDDLTISIPITSNTNLINLSVTPYHREDLEKNISIYINNDCISGNYDCEGVCDGDAIIDECGICNGIGIPDGYCDCNGNQFDCEGICGGIATIDECGVCGGNGPEILCDNDVYVCDESECDSGGGCEEGFTYFELNEIPNSTIVLDQSQCFSNIDLGVLEDIITINNLDIAAIDLGTQNWFNGHITRLTIGNFYDGGNVSLTMLPETIGNLPNIAILYLNYNELTSLPDSITNLTNLIYLVLSFNQLTHLPDNIGNLSNMVWLDLGYNSIEYLPESIGDFSIINYLWIFNNQLTSIPETICNLNLDWNGLDYNFLPYFGSGGNMLCDNTIPECVVNSDNFNTSIDPLYYSFLITVEQDCSNTECGQMDINGDGTTNVIDIVALVNKILSEQDITDEDLCTYDVTQDGLVNVIDIVALVNSILGG